MPKFLVFADLHYKKGMYASTLTHLEAITERAQREGAEFMIHLGDMCNDYAGSPEIVRAYLSNPHSLPAFGVYGNHELETKSNSMANVTPLLCNRDVSFGGDDAGYWYYDISGLRLIGLDTNYSYNEAACRWQHNAPASWGPPAGNIHEDSLGPAQLKWLDETLRDAHENGVKALIFSHAAFSGEWQSSSDAEAVRGILAKYNGTVLMCLNGHLHTDHFCIKEGIAYCDINTVLNGYWKIADKHHYTEAHTFTRETFAPDGSVTGEETARLDNLTQGMNTWFFDDPLSAIVEIAEDNSIRITGSRTEWKYGIAPPDDYEGARPCITDRYFAL